MASLPLPPGQTPLSFKALLKPHLLQEAFLEFPQCALCSAQPSHPLRAVTRWGKHHMGSQHHHSGPLLTTRASPTVWLTAGQAHQHCRKRLPILRGSGMRGDHSASLAPTHFSTHWGLCSPSQPLAQGPEFLFPSSRLLEKEASAPSSEGSPTYLLLPSLPAPCQSSPAEDHRSPFIKARPAGAIIVPS